ncbi:MAG: hypothetical protein ACOX4L_11705 [Bacillota bacterium]
MSQIKKPRNLQELKSLVNNYKGALSSDNVKIINEIINQIEGSGGVNQDNRSQIKSLMTRLARRNGVKMPVK